MTTNLQISSAIEAALVQGDLSKLTAEQRISYYRAVCESVGLNPLTKPFDYITLNGKLTLYAKRDCTDQLRKLNSVSITITAREAIGDVYVVTARAKDAKGREDESTGAVAIAGLKGEALANAYMKAETKAKRRVTLSVCGLGLLDESEMDSIPSTQPLVAEGSVVAESKPAALLAPAAQEDPGAYVMPFGKYKGKRLDEIGVHDIDGYARWMRQDSQTKGKPFHGVSLEAINAIDAFLADRQFDRNKEGA